VGGDAALSRPDGSRGIRASGSRPIHQRRCGVLVPWRCPVLTQAWPLVRFAGRRLQTAPAVKAAGRASERNDILPRLAIAPHPQLTTDKSAFSPLDKIARQSTPGWRAVWMECWVHDLPPTPATVRNLVSHAGMSVTRGTKSQSSAAARANTSAAPPRHGTTARAASSTVVHGGKVGSPRAQPLRPLGDVGGDGAGLRRA
jgi:hypothetical protein